MRKLSYLLLILSLVLLSFGMPTGRVSAEDGVQLIKVASSDNATLGDSITYTYTIVNNGQVEITDISLNDDKLGAIPLLSDNATALSLAPGENVTATASYTVEFKDLLAGSIKNIATVTGLDPDGSPVSVSSGEVIVSTNNIIKALLTKYEVLKLSGVPGKGIDNAPGLQKPFNPNSQAGEHAGQKDGNGNGNGNGNGHGKNKK